MVHWDFMLEEIDRRHRGKFFVWSSRGLATRDWGLRREPIVCALRYSGYRLPNAATSRGYSAHLRTDNTAALHPVTDWC